jgi:uncharacterized protein
MTNRLAIAAAVLAFTLAACGAEEGGVSELPVEDVVAGKEDGAAAARFETFTGRDGQSYFHLLAGNGQKMLQSEGYASKQKANEGILSVRTNGAAPESYDLIEAQDGQWYFNLVAANGQTIGTSELYVTRSNAERALSTVVGLVRAAAETRAAKVAKFQTFRGLDAQHYFHLRAGNGEIVLQSQGYVQKASALNGIASVRQNGIDGHRYQIKDAASGQAYFVLQAANGEVIGVSETYSSRSNAQQGAAAVAAMLTSASSL